ncbi:hypothetical protein GGF32_006885 [Allomyces javanicus]|nr:hypothetical protein GGF32_006885 [Allomyces javanicus]
MTTFQYQYRIPNSSAHRTIPDAALRAPTLADLKELIENDASVRAFIAQVLADFTQGHGQHREETIEAANAEDDKEEDATPAVQFRTKNGKGKPVATSTAETAPGSSSSQSTQDAPAAGSTAGSSKDPRAPPATHTVVQQRAASTRPAAIPRAADARPPRARLA